GREDPPRPLPAGAHQLGERGGVEGPRLDAVDPQCLERPPHLPRRLVGEGDGKDLVRAERTRGDLLCDPPRDRRRLAGASARENAHRPAYALGSAPLFWVQPVEHRATLARRTDGARKASGPKVCLLLPAARGRPEA